MKHNKIGLAPVLLLMANVALFGFDRADRMQLVVPLVAVASIALMTVVYGRKIMHRPLVIAVPIMASLVVVDLADAGLIPVVRI